MRRVIWAGSFIFLVVLGGFFKLALQTAQSRSNGSQLNTSDCAGCHGGGTGGAGTITGIPATYVPGTAYPINVSISGGPAARWGFRLTATGGTFTAGNGSQAASSTVITHTVAGTSQNSWSFNWTAPVATVGAVAFAGGALSANNDGGTDGDSPLTLPAATSQPGATCSYNLSATSQNFTSSAGTGTVNVTSGTGCNWTATSNDPFITITSGGSVTGNGTVNYSVTANSSTSARVGTLTIAGQTYTVNQAAATVTCAYALSASSKSFSNSAGTGSVNVTTTAGCSWTAVSNDPFITITSGSSVTGNGTVNYSVAANPSTSARSGTLTIAGQTYSVTQAAGTVTCAYTLSASSQNFSNAAGTGNVNVTTTAGCSWTAVSNDPFITITSGSSVTGNGTVNYSVTANPSTSARSGTLTIAGQTYTATQAAGTITCAYTLSASSQNFSSAAGTGSVNVTTTAGCNWTAVSNDPFITIISGSSVTGNGTVNYSVIANNTSAVRTGTMTIAGQSFTITQTSAASSAFALTRLSPTSKEQGSDSFLLHVYGDNLTSNAVVLWNGIPKVTLFQDATEVLAIIPARDLSAPGEIPITIKAGAATSTSLPFTITAESVPSQPQLEAVMPKMGSVVGNTKVVLVGRGFTFSHSDDVDEHPTTTDSSVGDQSDDGSENGENSGVQVFFGGIPLTHVNILNSRRLEGITPPHAAGPVDVVVVFASGQRASLTAGYTYIDTQSVPPPNSSLLRWTIPYLVDSNDFRTNLGINNLDSTAADVTISLVDSQGQIISKTTTTVPARGMKQIDNVVREMQNSTEITGWEGYLLLESTSNIRAWASQIDNLTNDPSLEVAKNSGSPHTLIPSSVSNGRYLTSLMVVNTSDSSGQITISVHDNGGVLQGKALTLPIPASGYLYYEDIYKSVGVSNASGPIFIDSNREGLTLLATARIYTLEDHTSGYLDGVNSNLAATKVNLPYTIDTDDFRTNIGIVNTGNQTASVMVNLIDRSGVNLGLLPITVPAGGMVQLNNINLQIIGTAVTSHLEGYLRLDSTQPIIAWSSQIDNLSQDPSLAIGNSTGSSHLLISSTTNRGSFKSTLVVVNLENSSTNVEIKFRDPSGNLAGTTTSTIPAGGFISYSDILSQIGVTDSYGPLEITSLDGKLLAAISRVYSTIHTGGFWEGMNWMF
jgi:hypothetical protein